MSKFILALLIQNHFDKTGGLDNIPFRLERYIDEYRGSKKRLQFLYTLLGYKNDSFLDSVKRYGYRKLANTNEQEFDKVVEISNKYAEDYLDLDIVPYSEDNTLSNRYSELECKIIRLLESYFISNKSFVLVVKDIPHHIKDLIKSIAVGTDSVKALARIKSIPKLKNIMLSYMPTLVYNAKSDSCNILGDILYCNEKYKKKDYETRIVEGLIEQLAYNVLDINIKIFSHFNNIFRDNVPQILFANDKVSYKQFVDVSQSMGVTVRKLYSFFRIPFVDFSLSEDNCIFYPYKNDVYVYNFSSDNADSYICLSKENFKNLYTRDLFKTLEFISGYVNLNGNKFYSNLIPSIFINRQVPLYEYLATNDIKFYR